MFPRPRLGLLAEITLDRKTLASNSKSLGPPPQIRWAQRNKGPFSRCISRWTHVFSALCSYEHANIPAPIFQQSQTQTPPPATPAGSKSMAQTTNHVRDLLEKIKGDAQRALALLPSEGELPSLSWKCTGCGYVKHFTRPVTAAVAERCPKCKGDSFRTA